MVGVGFGAGFHCSALANAEGFPTEYAKYLLLELAVRNVIGERSSGSISSSLVNLLTSAHVGSRPKRAPFCRSWSVRCAHQFQRKSCPRRGLQVQCRQQRSHCRLTVPSCSRDQWLRLTPRTCRRLTVPSCPREQSLRLTPCTHHDRWKSSAREIVLSRSR